MFGRCMYALGGNEQAARLAGIQVIASKSPSMRSPECWQLWPVSLHRAASPRKPDAGTGAELDAIAAVVIGGTNLMGGRGSMTGTLVGVLIFGFLGNILLLKNIDSNTQLVLKGLIILGAVLLQEGQMAGWLRRFRPRVEKPPDKRPPWR